MGWPRFSLPSLFLVRLAAYNCFRHVLILKQASGAKHHLLALTEDITPLLLECAGSPHKRDVSIEQVDVVGVMDSAFFREDVLVNPLSDFRGRDYPGIRQPVFASETDGRMWPVCAIAWHSSPCLFHRFYLHFLADAILRDECRNLFVIRLSLNQLAE